MTLGTHPRIGISFKIPKHYIAKNVNVLLTISPGNGRVVSDYYYKPQNAFGKSKSWLLL